LLDLPSPATTGHFPASKEADISQKASLQTKISRAQYFIGKRVDKFRLISGTVGMLDLQKRETQEMPIKKDSMTILPRRLLPYNIMSL
jgi:hypothetical protein